MIMARRGRGGGGGGRGEGGTRGKTGPRACERWAHRVASVGGEEEGRRE